MKHTPGPWHYQENSDAYTHIVRGPSGYFVHQGSQHTDGVSKANALLIAAAPELLEACLEMVTAVEMEGANGLRFFEARNSALIAIRKAEGK
jgi:hypothetical protein